MDRHLHPEEGHSYVHKLVLCPESKPDEPKALSVEERLETMEKHMETTKKHMEEMEKRMEETEKHIEAMTKHIDVTGKHIEATEMHIEETKKHIEVSQCSLQDLLVLQKEKNDAIQKGIEGLFTWGTGLIVLVFTMWVMMRG